MKQLIGFILILISFASSAQELFRPGPYAKGDKVSANNAVFVAKVDIKNAVTVPTVTNAYWLKVSEAPAVSVAKNFGINLVERGIINTNFSPQQNSANLKAFILSYPERSTVSLYVPTGTYRMAEAIELHHRPFYIFGDNGTIWGESSRFVFPPGVTGFNITRANSTGQETIIERILVQAEGKNNINASGFRFLGRAKFRDCTAKGFSWNGFDGYAQTTDVAHDISGSLIESCHSLENGGDGFFLGGVDANSLTVINCDARDNGGYGFNDASFLGNNFIGCMAHYNQKGDFYVKDKSNAKSQFVGSYSEGGNIPSDFSLHTAVIGGTWGTGYTINGQSLQHDSYVPKYEVLFQQVKEVWDAINHDRGNVSDLRTKVQDIMNRRTVNQ